MKTTTILATLALFTSLTFSCEKEILRPESAVNPAAALSLTPPSNPCGNSSIVDLVDLNNNSTTLGQIEILNDASDLYLLMDMNAGWVITRYYIYAGESASVPESAGVCLVEDFDYQALVQPYENDYTVTIPLTDLENDFDIIVKIEVGKLDFYGNLTEQKSLMLDGTTIFDLRYESYEEQECS